MNTFLKALGIALLVLIAIKLLPLTLFVGFVLFGSALLVLAVTASAAAAVLCLALVAAALLAPVWLPILVIVGVIALVRGSRRAGVA